MLTRPGTALLAALGACLALSPAAMADTDIGSLLVAAPSSDWVELDADRSQVIGPFDALDYDVYQKDSGSSERALNRDGFVAGYGREWEQRGTRDGLIERVFQFRTSGGALSWYRGLKLGNQTAKEYKRDIAALGPEDQASFGVELDFSDGWRDYRIEFAKGDYFFAIHMGSAASDYAAGALAQAQKQYDAAPEPAPEPVNPGLARANTAPLLVGGGIVIGLIVVVTVAVIAVVAVRGRRRPPIAPSSAGAGVTMSPDGAYWWDGGRWRLVATDPPPPA